MDLHDFRDVAENYDRYLEVMYTQGTDHHEGFQEFYLDLARKYGSGGVVDVACGTGAVLLYLAEHRIAVISLHTNLDSAPGGVNDVLAERLGLQNIRTFDGSEYGIGRIGDVPEQELEAFAQFVKERLGAGGVRYADGGKPVNRVAVGGGSCMDFLPQALEAGCDTFVTGDVKYHQFQKAAALGVNLIDAGHFPTEDPVCEVLCGALAAKFPGIAVKKSAIHADCVKFA